MAKQLQYIGARYVVKIYENSTDPSSAEWQPNINYEPLVMVTYNMGSYLSKKAVPASIGNPADNKYYWVQTGFYNGQIMELQQAVNDLNNALATETSNRRTGDNTLQQAINSLNTNMQSEIRRLDNSDSQLAQNIINEVTNRQNADSNLTTLINNVSGNLDDEVAARIAGDNNLQTQINQIISPSGEAPSAAEVENARIGNNGVTYQTLGTAIRTQVGELTGDTVTLSNFPTLEWTLNRNVDGTGAIVTNMYTAITTLIKCDGDDRIIRRGTNTDGTNLLLFYVNEYDESQTWTRRNELTLNSILTLQSTTRYIRFAFGRASSSGVQIQQSDLSMFGAEFYRKAALNCEAFIFRGRITTLGYTSLAQCKDDGYYRFTTADVPSISDLPEGWKSGGILKTYVFNPSTMWQVLEGQEGSYIRYNDGAWYCNSGHVILVKYDPTPGDDDSDEQLNIIIPRNNSFKDAIMYNMGRCIDNDVNCDVWRIIKAYEVDGNSTNTMTRSGEWECALHLAGADDFIGGRTHGDEIEEEIEVFMDGKLVSVSSASGTCTELKIIRTSILYDPSDHVTPVAKHGVEYVYNNEGLKISQSVKWLENESLTKCYLAMLPVLKTYSTYSYNDIDYEIVTNGSDNYDVPIANCKSVSEYASDKNLHLTMSISDYPSGLTGGDNAFITDNGGLPYNKVYFVVCSSGNVTAGEIWKSTSFIKHR